MNGRSRNCRKDPERRCHKPEPREPSPLGKAILYFRMFDADSNRRFFFASENRAPLFDRREELKALNKWLDKKGDFSWTLITGPGGAGKSRLALELCLQAVARRWNAGFLTRGSSVSDPGQLIRFEPKAPTLTAIAGVEDIANLDESSRAVEGSAHVPVPAYLQQIYWWAYLHPNAVRVFERQWLVNLILWGNFAELRDATLDEMGASIDGTILQVACVYGNFTERLAQRLEPTGRLDVLDVAPVQLENLKAKLKGAPRVALHHQDSANLRFADASYDCVVLFFLLHEQPESTRIQTIAQALRVVKPGCKVIFVDYHRPDWINPFRYLMTPILKSLEPFAMDMWRKDIADWLPEGASGAKIEKQTFFGGLYQKVVVTR